jgi:carbonic anhydrase
MALAAHRALPDDDDLGELPTPSTERRATGVWTSLLVAHEAVRDPGRVLVPDHAPTAAILTCSDARVPPSVIFDQPAGSLFVVRVAGNSATPAAVASFDYAVSELGVPLIIVLGHTNCGAVTAAREGACDGYLSPLTSQICDLIEDGEHVDTETLAERNVYATMASLAASDSPAGEAIRAGRVEVRGAIYAVGTDDVRCLTPEITTDNPQSIGQEP